MNTEGSKRKQERLRRTREQERRARATEIAEERKVWLTRCRERCKEHRSGGIRSKTVLAHWQSVSLSYRK